MQEEEYYQDDIPEKKQAHGDQKMSWSLVCKFDDYADALKMKLAHAEHDVPTKIRRRKVGFDLMKGTPLKKAKEETKDEAPKKKKAPQRNDKKARAAQLKAAEKS